MELAQYFQAVVFSLITPVCYSMIVWGWNPIVPLASLNVFRLSLIIHFSPPLLID
jgi:hypothetical protein